MGRGRGKLAVLAIVVSLLAVPAAQARTPYLGYGEAARAIGAQLHKTFRYGAIRGSLTADCRRRARNRVGCWISFYDLDEDGWCGRASVTENRAYYSVGWSVKGC